MSVLTYDTASTTTVAPIRKVRRKGFWARAFDRLIEARVRQAIQRVIVSNLAAEEELDAEARRILQGYARDIRDQGLDYRQLLAKTREKLARDRGFVL